MHNTADILFVPYNYLIEKEMRRSLTGVSWAKTILIFDEAHNLASLFSIFWVWKSAWSSLDQFLTQTHVGIGDRHTVQIFVEWGLGHSLEVAHSWFISAFVTYLSLPTPRHGYQ